jgi:TldD protein
MDDLHQHWDTWAQVALDSARQAGARYADVRIMRWRSQTILARNERIHGLEDSDSRGFGVRCLVDGAWGFASSSILSHDSVQRVAGHAAAIARASATTKERDVVLAPEAPHVAIHQTPREIDPFEVPLDAKTSLLLEANALMRRVNEIKMALGFLQSLKQEQLYASTEGSLIRRDRIITQGVLQAHAAGNGDRQNRTYRICGKHAGWEHILSGDLLAEAPRVAREARDKLFAEVGPVGPRDLILDPEHLYLTIHESIGHATELDRVLGFEADFAGTSFATPEKLGSYRYANRIVQAVADTTTPEFLASTGFDDEGVAGQKWDIIRDGILVDYATGREFAPYIGSDRSHGTCRSDGWWSLPIVRIPNLGLLPGQGTPEDLIADTKDGVFIQGSGYGSIDQRRMNFQFGGDLCWRIRDGKRDVLLKNVIYQSNTPTFWNACDAICGPEDWRAVGETSCGKGQPVQRGMMTHFSSTARFRQIEVERGQE